MCIRVTAQMWCGGGVSSELRLHICIMANNTTCLLWMDEETHKTAENRLQNRCRFDKIGFI